MTGPLIRALGSGYFGQSGVFAKEKQNYKKAARTPSEILTSYKQIAGRGEVWR